MDIKLIMMVASQILHKARLSFPAFCCYTAASNRWQPTPALQ